MITERKEVKYEKEEIKYYEGSMRRVGDSHWTDF